MKSLPEERLMELLDEWGVPDDRVPDHAKLLATVGITMQGLAQANMADLAAVLAGGKEQATPIHDFDATTIIKGAAAVVRGMSSVVADAEFLKVVVDVAVEAATTAVQVTMGPVQTLLHIMLMGDIKPTAASSSRGKDVYRKDAFQYYYDDPVPDKATCMVTGEQLPAEKIIAGHVYRQAWNPAVLAHMARMSTHDPRNIVLMRSQVKEKFNLFEITIIPQEDEDNYQVVVLNPELWTLPIGSGSGTDTLKWFQVNGMPLSFSQVLPGRRPARRVLALHAARAVAWAEQHGWIARGEVQVPEEGWRSPGYDRIQMQKFLNTVLEADAGSDE